MGNHNNTSKIVAFLMLIPAFSGCMEDSVDDPLELEFSVDILVGGEVQNLRIVSSERMSVLVPYLIFNPETGYYQNGTILDFNNAYASYTVQILVPPSSEECIFLLSEYGRDEWPVRKTNESWRESKNNIKFRIHNYRHFSSSSHFNNN